eukprot:1148441-Pelagomonas_calceolata.AAC.4
MTWASTKIQSQIAQGRLLSLGTGRHNQTPDLHMPSTTVLSFSGAHGCKVRSCKGKSALANREQIRCKCTLSTITEVINLSFPRVFGLEAGVYGANDGQGCSCLLGRPAGSVHPNILINKREKVKEGVAGTGILGFVHIVVELRN